MKKHEIICIGNNDVRKVRVKKITYYTDLFDEVAQVVVMNTFAEMVYKLQVKIFGIWITIKQYESLIEEDDEYLWKCAVCDYNRLVE